MAILKARQREEASDRLQGAHFCLSTVAKSTQSPYLGEMYIKHPARLAHPPHFVRYNPTPTAPVSPAETARRWPGDTILCRALLDSFEGRWGRASVSDMLTELLSDTNECCSGTSPLDHEKTCWRGADVLICRYYEKSGWIVEKLKDLPKELEK
jgi:hypothetical protein